MKKELKNKKVSFLKEYWAELIILIALIVGAIYYSIGTFFLVLCSLLFAFYFSAMLVARSIVMLLDLEMQKLQRSRKDKTYIKGYMDALVYVASLFLGERVCNTR